MFAQVIGMMVVVEAKSEMEQGVVLKSGVKLGSTPVSARVVDGCCSRSVYIMIN